MFLEIQKIKEYLNTIITQNCKIARKCLKKIWWSKYSQMCL